MTRAFAHHTRRGRGIIAGALILALPLVHTEADARDAPASLERQARSILGSGQGVYVEASDGSVLLAQAAATAVHPASVSKVPTTLALLRKFGPEHRFVTSFASRGRIASGTLYGDLIVSGGGDPFFVDENALLVAERLNEMGVRRVAGTLRLSAPVTFDWQRDETGDHLRRALSGIVSGEALASVRALMALRTPGLAPVSALTPAVQFVSASGPDEGPPPVGGASAQLTANTAAGSAANPAPLSAENTGAPQLLQARALVLHRSQPLLSLAKALNDYSNNIFAPLAEQAGGAAEVETLARSLLPASMRNEITLGDGAGADPRNRLSPRAAVKLLRALDEALTASHHRLCDILPVAGIDAGTLQRRLNGAGEIGRVVGKTGTFGDYGASALVGAIPTADRGAVYFAILNHGIPVPEARRRQDQFVRVLLAHLHSLPWKYQPDSRPAIALADVTALP